jgi:hypothetical protein
MNILAASRSFSGLVAVGLSLLLQATVNANKKKPINIFFIAAKLRLTGETGFENGSGREQKSAPVARDTLILFAAFEKLVTSFPVVKTSFLAFFLLGFFNLLFALPFLIIGL